MNAASRVIFQASDDSNTWFHLPTNLSSVSPLEIQDGETAKHLQRFYQALLQP